MKRIYFGLSLATLLLVLCCIPLVTGHFDWSGTTGGSPLSRATVVEDVGEGKVTRVIRVKRYAYLRLKESEPGTWHVVMGQAPQVGQRVRYTGYAQLDDFHSASLKPHI